MALRPAPRASSERWHGMASTDRAPYQNGLQTLNADSLFNSSLSVSLMHCATAQAAPPDTAPPPPFAKHTQTKPAFGISSLQCLTMHYHLQQRCPTWLEGMRDSPWSHLHAPCMTVCGLAGLDAAVAPTADQHHPGGQQGGHRRHAPARVWTTPAAGHPVAKPWPRSGCSPGRSARSSSCMRKFWAGLPM